MKLHISLLVLFLFTSRFTNGQSLPSQKEQYDFLNWYINYKKPIHVRRSMVRISEAQILAGDGYRMIKVKLTLADQKYLYRQIAANRETTGYDTTLLNAVHWKEPSESEQPFTQLSLPIFSRDRKLVIITNNYYNLQADPGNSETGLELYAKVKDGVWRLCGLQPFDKQIIVSQLE